MSAVRGSNWERAAFAEKVSMQSIARLKPLGRQTRRHSPSQINKLAGSLDQFGWVNPILVDEDHRVMAGMGRLAAARQLGWEQAPCLVVTHLSPDEKRAYVITDNRSAEFAEWDHEVLEVEFAELAALDLGFDLELTGFDQVEIEAMGQDEEPAPSPEPVKPSEPVSVVGDVWICGPHLVGCFDATDPMSLEALAPGEQFAACITDAPYNIAIKGMVTSKRNHREFVMASGEMSDDQFTQFLIKSYGAAAARLKPGGLLYAAMDWRHAAHVLAAANALELEYINLCVWCKPNAGQGSFYRSQHELFFVLKKPGGPHNNRVRLGKHGRNRSNVWNYPGVVGGGRKTRSAHADHPSPKNPVMIRDILLDCTDRGESVVDVFGGGGSLLVAAEQSNRHARLLDLDPGYVDVMVQRWCRLTGGQPVLRSTGRNFDEVAAERAVARRAPQVRVRTRRPLAEA